MPIVNAGMSLDAIKALPGFKQVDPGVFGADNGDFFSLDPSGGVQTSRNLADFQIGAGRSQTGGQPTPTPAGSTPFGNDGRGINRDPFAGLAGGAPTPGAGAAGPRGGAPIPVGNDTWNGQWPPTPGAVGARGGAPIPVGNDTWNGQWPAYQPSGQTTQPLPRDPGYASNPGSGIPWAPGSDHPSSNPSGYHWDPTMANFVPDGAGAAGAAPSYINQSDPLQAAVLAAYQRKGIVPRDQADFQYWVDRINQTGGWNDPGNQTYWLEHMGRSQGGVGDYLQRPEAGGGGGGTPTPAPRYQPLNPTQTGTVQDAVAYLNQLNHGLGGQDLTPAELQQYAQMVGYVDGQPVTGAMMNQIAAALYQRAGQPMPGGQGAPGGGGGQVPPQSPTVSPSGGTYTPTNPFDDPATKNYIDLLNSRIQALLQPRQDPSLDAFMKMISDRANGLNTPFVNPDAGPLTDYMRKYFAQLQAPGYTDAQRGLINTNALDPLERAHQAELQQVAQRMASRGITPGSGPYLEAERAIDQKFDQLRTQTQSGLAVNEINQGRQNNAQAVNVGGQLAAFNQGQFANNENRANQAVSLFGQIPQLNLSEFQNQDQRANSAVGMARQIPDIAQQRVQQAISLLNGNNINPAQLMSALQGFQQQGINQNQTDSAAWQAIFANMAKAFGLG